MVIVKFNETTQEEWFGCEECLELWNEEGRCKCDDEYDKNILWQELKLRGLAYRYIKRLNLSWKEFITIYKDFIDIEYCLNFYTTPTEERSCCFCKSKKDIEIDHIIPISSGGNSKRNNLRFLCKKCNRSKSCLTDNQVIEMARNIMLYRENERKKIESVRKDK